MWQIANILKLSKSSVKKIICTMLGYITCFDVWVPHKQKLKKKKTSLGCISTWDSLLKCNENVLFLKQFMMSGEKWICNNVEWKGSWGKQNEPSPITPKASLHPKKVMLYICWGLEGSS